VAEVVFSSGKARADVYEDQQYFEQRLNIIVVLDIIGPLSLSC
jgi:hypothetical protein